MRFAKADEDVLSECLGLLSLPSSHMHQPTLAKTLEDRLRSIYIASNSDTGEWTTRGKRRKNVQKTRNGAKRSLDDSSSDEDKDSGKELSLDKDSYASFTIKELKNVLRARGLKVLMYPSRSTACRLR